MNEPIFSTSHPHPRASFQAPPRAGADLSGNLTNRLVLQKAFAILCLCALGLIWLSGCAAKHVDQSKEQSENEHVKVKTVAVQTVPLQQATTQPASVLAYHRAEIHAKANGYVSKVVADIGDVVEAGQPLAILDIPEMAKQREVLAARIQRFQSDEQRAKAGLQLAQAAIDSARAKVEQANAENQQVDATLAAAEAQFARTNDLVQKRALQKRLLDEARKNRDSVTASKASVASAIDAAQADVNVSQAKRDSASADLKVAEAETQIVQRQLEELDALISYAILKAPFRGVVTQRNLDPGDLVTADSKPMKPLFVVSQVDKVRIQIPVPETDAARVNKGDAITLRFPSFPAETIQASVTRLSGELDPSTRTMLVEAEVDNANRKLIPGMFGQASIAVSTKTAANMLPARAVRFDEKGKAYVYALQNDDVVSIQEVQTGVDNGQMIEVIGLAEGQAVVDANLKRLQDGQQVTIIQ